MKYFSMFSGIGGFELGIQGECVGYSEVDQYAKQIYKKHFNHKGYGDARRIIWQDTEDFNLLCGGFPCQSFSIAGKRGGFTDTRGTLFFEIARAISIKRPKLLLLENVKGLLSHDNGRTLGTILTTLSDLGYICEWQVLNSKDFGVPQNRERVFIVGHLGGTSGRKVFPLRGSNEQADCKTVMDVSQAQRVYHTDGIAVSQKALGGGQGAKTGLYFVNEERFREYTVSDTCQSLKVGGDVPRAVLTPDRAEKRQNGRRMKGSEESSFTLTAQDIHGIMKSGRIRRLTPTECERLQGFPDGWTEGLSDTQRYKVLGNAVTTNVIEAIMKGVVNGQEY